MTDNTTKKPAPGSIPIRPTRAAAEENEDAFYDLLEFVRRKEIHGGTLPLKALAERIGLGVSDPTKTPDELATKIWKQIKEKNLKTDAQKLLLRLIFEEENLLLGKTRDELAKVPDAFYFAFLNFFRTRETSQDNARASVIGTYRLHRFSVEHDKEFVCGKIVFEEDKDTRAVIARMIQPKLAHDGTRQTIERFSGYFFRVANMYLMILRDLVNNDLRATLFPRFKAGEIGTEVNKNSVFQGRHSHIVHMDGFGLGIDGAHVFFSPVHLELVDDVDELMALDDQLDVVPEDKVPPRIVAKLNRNGPLKRL